MISPRFLLLALLSLPAGRLAAKDAASEPAESAPAPAAAATIDGSAPGFRQLTGDDFTNVNCHENTWTWTEGTARCTGQPIGVIRSKKTFTNFELVAQWRHLTAAGNSGIFVWADDAALRDLKPGTLPRGGIEVQVLANGFTAKFEKETGKPGNWFTTHGDVFPVGTAKLKPFPPLSPDGSRSFPSQNLSKDAPQWNHYYIRAINGEIRLWVNGQEVSGGNEASPSTGYLCLESEGAPVEFKNLRLRELP
jgi:hypothetical protein